jgi:hypothetical protein
MTVSQETALDARSSLRELLMSWDLLGISDEPACLDEYDCMIDPLVEQLGRGDTEERIQAWIVGEVEEHFGVKVSPNQVDEARLARGVVSWWNARRDGGLS